jgi:farnesyl-diphosphate farnesyltransferase
VTQALDEALEVVREYSTTWYEPMLRMPPRLDEATACAYLMMRGIDEIEDHPRLDGATKARLLQGVAHLLQTRFTLGDLREVFRGQGGTLPQVSLRLGEWVTLAPAEIAPRIWDTFAAMAERMADWTSSGFAVHSESDLDRYTYAVGSTLVLLLSDLWAWHDGTHTNRTHAVGYGRALQAINILVDRSTDLDRGVDFWPDGWGTAQMTAYARRQLSDADAYVEALPEGPARTGCQPPLERAHHALAQVEG